MRTRLHKLCKSTNEFRYLQLDAAVDIRCRLESENGKDYNTGIDCCDGITDGDEQNVTDAIVFGRVVAAKGYQRPKGQAKGVEDLCGSIEPHRRIGQFLYFGRVHMHEARTGTG